jgi:hypothetical protein
MDKCLPTRISDMSGIYWLDDAKQVPDTQVVTYDYGDFLLTWELRSFAEQPPIEDTEAGTAFYGTDASLIVKDDEWYVVSASGERGPAVKSTGMTHEANFLECVKSRKLPHADVEIGRLSTMLCHLGNISCKLKRSVRFDPKTERFPGDEEANRLLTKEYRQPYGLPRV